MFFVKRGMSLFVQIIVLFIMQTDIYEVSFFEISMVFFCTKEQMRVRNIVCKWKNRTMYC